MHLNYQITSNAQQWGLGADSEIANVLLNEFETMAV
jgi:hypothetical protein